MLFSFKRTKKFLFNRKNKTLRILIFTLVILTIVGIRHQPNNQKISTQTQIKISEIKKNEKEINIASVVCGGKHRARYILPLVKSAILFSDSKLNIHLFTDIPTGDELKRIFSNLTENIKARVDIIFYNASFPEENKRFWQNLYKMCATQRIFYQNFIKNFNEIIHFDADMIIVSRLETIWEKFKELSSKEILGAANDCKTQACKYYRFRIPVVGQFGINSGLMFMKLDELRRFDFVNKIIEIRNKTKYRIYGDQDMINFLFHNQTDLVKQFDCTHNFFPNVYCNKTSECDPKNGIKIVHGVMNQFEINKNSFFGSLARKLIDIDLNRDKRDNIKELIKYIKSYNHTDQCIVTKPFLLMDYK